MTLRSSAPSRAAGRAGVHAPRALAGSHVVRRRLVAGVAVRRRHRRPGQLRRGVHRLQLVPPLQAPTAARVVRLGRARRPRGDRRDVPCGSGSTRWRSSSLARFIYCSWARVRSSRWSSPSFSTFALHSPMVSDSRLTIFAAFAAFFVVDSVVRLRFVDGAYKRDVRARRGGTLVVGWGAGTSHLVVALRRAARLRADRRAAAAGQAAQWVRRRAGDPARDPARPSPRRAR